MCNTNVAGRACAVVAQGSTLNCSHWGEAYLKPNMFINRWESRRSTSDSGVIRCGVNSYAWQRPLWGFRTKPIFPFQKPPPVLLHAMKSLHSALRTIERACEECGKWNWSDIRRLDEGGRRQQQRITFLFFFFFLTRWRRRNAESGQLVTERSQVWKPETIYRSKVNERCSAL